MKIRPNVGNYQQSLYQIKNIEPTMAAVRELLSRYKKHPVTQAELDSLTVEMYRENRDRFLKAWTKTYLIRGNGRAIAFTNELPT